MRTLTACLVFLMLAPTVWGQTPVAVPNSMAPHTAFIVVIIAAFLAWAASFSVTTRKEHLKGSSKSLLADREAILDQLAEAERQRTSGELSTEEFNRQSRRLRGRLAGVLARLDATGERQKAH